MSEEYYISPKLWKLIQGSGGLVVLAGIISFFVFPDFSTITQTALVQNSHIMNLIALTICVLCALIMLVSLLAVVWFRCFLCKRSELPVNTKKPTPMKEGIKIMVTATAGLPRKCLAFSVWWKYIWSLVVIVDIVLEIQFERVR